ncbi:hypothetical protein FLAG1_05075 [Fusarium langsethiae]|uniref:Uncharacterized protein n=1 Tax=Fusarium langsethiae TaxID=179993 RepID=A0A0M9EXR0_FUSLA|nr:hypothetical protein FLAG1_05075 [Fusarium langsethiae]GKU04670.1 unnamed protein product [Fusarium langsethiae]GKU19159.1 unnamed protein product [Fusarium langsethiae]
MNAFEYFFHGMAGHAFHPTFLRVTGNETRENFVPTPIPWYTPPPAPTPKFHHWRGGFSAAIDECVFIFMVTSSVLIWCGLLLIWFRVRKSEIDFQHVLPLRDTEDGTGAMSEEMQQFIQEPVIPSSPQLRRSMEKTEGGDFVVGEDSDHESDS